MAQQGCLPPPLRRQGRLNGTEGHARKILTDRRMEEELGNALSFSICSLVHINGIPPKKELH